MNARENAKRLPHDYAVGDKVMLKVDGVKRKAAYKYTIPYTITEVHTNGTVRIRRGKVSERLNIRRLTPFFGDN